MLLSKLLLVISLLLATTVIFAQDKADSEITTRPEPSKTIFEDGITLDLYFENISQGQVGLARISGSRIVSIHASFLDKDFEFFQSPGDGYYGFLGVGMEQRIGNHNFVVIVELADKTTAVIDASINVVLGTFIQQPVTISEDLRELITPEVENRELALLEIFLDTSTPSQLWDTNGFQWPLEAELTSPFGAFRIFNDTTSSRHTGWDMRSKIGTPISATAAGKIVFAGTLDLRGNYVLIDHGYGVYSGYAHLSVVYVTRGEDIAAGQIVGQVGSSGRSGGAHFHWEMAVNGEWVDSVRFTDMWIPNRTLLTEP